MTPSLVIAPSKRHFTDLFTSEASSGSTGTSVVSMETCPVNMETAYSTKTTRSSSMTNAEVLQRGMSDDMRSGQTRDQDIKSAVARDQENFIGDFSKPCVLPTITGKHQDLKSVSPHTVYQLLNGRYSQHIDTYQVIDCRYPYEFEGGHIQNATNIWQRADIPRSFLGSDIQREQSDKNKRNIIIFHCEFSSERGPKMCRFLRELDREANKDCYPSLYHPELYILEGGYKAFYQHYPELCAPHDYKPMLHPDHVSDVKHFRVKSKSWAGEKSSRVNRRHHLLL